MIVKLLFLLAIPLSAFAVSVGADIPLAQGGQPALGQGLSHLANEKPCGSDMGPGAASDQEIEDFIVCYQNRQREAAQLIAPYAAQSSSALAHLETLRRNLRTAIGLSGP